MTRSTTEALNTTLIMLYIADFLYNQWHYKEELMQRLCGQDSGELGDFWLLYHAKTFHRDYVYYFNNSSLSNFPELAQVNSIQ